MVEQLKEKDDIVTKFLTEKVRFDQQVASFTREKELFQQNSDALRAKEKKALEKLRLIEERELSNRRQAVSD